MWNMIRVIDIETAGLAPPDHGVCEVGWCDVWPGNPVLSHRSYDWAVGAPMAIFVNPGRSIPPESSAVHHITDADVAGAPKWPVRMVLDPDFHEVGEPGWDAFAAHNAKFERQWCTDDLTGGLPWICTYKCALRLWPNAPVHSNQGLRYWRRPDGLDRETALPPHRAGPDAYVTAHLLAEMLNEGADIHDLIRWSSEPALQVTCQIGKWRGTPWREVDYGFLAWVAERDFDEDVLFTVKTEMERRRADVERDGYTGNRT